MKTLIKAVALALVFAAPVASFAQSSQGLTRGEVRADLVRAEQAGYNPNGDRTTYPAELQAADARVAQQADSGYGPAVSGASQSGRRTDTTVSSYSPPVYIAH